MVKVEGSFSLVLLFALGIMMISIPEKLWKLEHFLSVKNGEPSEFYIVMMRIGGVVFTSISVILSLGFVLGWL